MGFFPITALFIGLFGFGVLWGWDGEELRQFFAVVSSIFMFSIWLNPLFVMSEVGGVFAFKLIPNWLPTIYLGNILFWNLILMYFTGAHLMETVGREDPIGKRLKRLRKQ